MLSGLKDLYDVNNNDDDSGGLAGSNMALPSLR
jgi:hypothetical protein